MNNYHTSVWLVSGITLRYRKGNWDGDLFQLLEEVGRWLTVEPKTGLCTLGSAHPPGVHRETSGFITLASSWWNPQSENLTTTVEGPSQRHRQCHTWGVFSCSLHSTQGLGFPVLPSSWKFLELKTCSLELVQVSNTSWDEFWKDKMQYVNLESACEEALQPRSCYICLQTKLHPLSLPSPICLCGAVNSQWMGWDVP